MSLFGTMAITDYGWYSVLSRHRYWDEVNFWTPSARFAFRAPEFSPFLFKLRAPHNAVAGFGYFVKYAALPDWLAWDCFGEGNGCETLDELRRRLQTIRLRIRYVESEPVPQLGCIGIVSAVFFAQEEWVRQPADWPLRAQRPVHYDLGRGEGKRVWTECLERIQDDSHGAVVHPDVAGEPESAHGTPTLVRPRLGQGTFRVSVTEAYRRACAATGEKSLPALEAAHIRPLARGGSQHTDNGLLLRADLHRLFDQGYLTVTHNYVLEVSQRLRLDYQNGRSYYPLHGARISVPDQPRERPDPALLRWHNEHVFTAQF